VSPTPSETTWGRGASGAHIATAGSRHKGQDFKQVSDVIGFAFACKYAQVVEHLSSKCKVLSSNPSITKKNQIYIYIYIYIYTHTYYINKIFWSDRGV
jgi:hypothetical protein